MRIEYQLVIGLIVAFGVCSLLLGYDVVIHKRIERQLEKDNARLRKRQTYYCNKDAIAALNGKD